MALVTLEQAKDHLGIWTPITSPLDPVDRKVSLIITQAEDIILDYLKLSGLSPVWTEVDVPPLVQAAVLVQIAELYRFRGDDPSSASTASMYPDGQLNPQVTAYLRRYRDPALA